MSFLSPLFLLGGLVVAMPIVLHLLKREPDARVRFSAVRLLRNAPVEHASRRHLRELLLLALRVAALLLLALAFARPFFASATAARSSEVTVIALDTSASMSAPGQFERARQLANAAIGRASGLVAVMTFSDGGQIVCAPTGDRALATAAITGAAAGAGATSYRAALNAASDLLARRQGRIVVVTDLQAGGWDAGDRASVPDSATIEIADVGAPPPNLAVTGARIADGRLIATLINTGTAAREATVTLKAGADDRDRAGTKVTETRLPIAAGRMAETTFDVPPGRWASVVVDDPTGSAADNARYLVLDNASRPAVLVVTADGDLSREAFYVEQALVAQGVDGRTYDAVGVAASALQSWDQARIDRQAAIVLMSTRGLEHHARALLADYARKGGGLLVAASADIDGEVLPEVLGGAKIGIAPPDARSAGGAARTLAASDVRHPVLQAFTGRSSLGLVKFRRVASVRAEGCQTLARFTSGEAALIECEVGQGRAVILASDLDNRWNDFPLHATFVPFVHQSVRYLSRARVAPSYSAGQVPAGVAPTPGVATAPPEGGSDSRLIAVNVEPRESEAARLTPDEFESAVTRLQGGAVVRETARAQEEEERQHMWQYVLAIMIAMMIVESAVATRTA